MRGALAGVGRRSLLSKVEDKANEVSQNTIGKVGPAWWPFSCLMAWAGHVPRLIRSASVTSQSSWWSLDLCSSVPTFLRFPFSFLEDVLHFPTFCSQPKIHSGPSTSNVSIRSPSTATVKPNMWKCTNQTPSTYMSYFLLAKMPLDTLLYADSLCPALTSPRSWRPRS